MTTSDEGRVFHDDETIGAARRWLREQARGHGAPCPVCQQMTKIYHRGLNVSMAHDLIRAWRRVGRADFHAPTVLDRGVGGGDFAKLRYWGVIEELDAARADGGRAGWWRITDVGEKWVRGTVGLPRYAYLFDGRLLRFDGDREQEWTVRDALEDRFDYDQLMSDPGNTDPPI